MRVRGLAAVAAALLAASAPKLAAQAWQSVALERAATAAEHLSIFVRHDAGRITIHPTRDSLRYRAMLRYDAHAVQPIYSFAADSGVLHLGTRQRSDGGRRGRASLDLALGSAGTVAVDVRAGAAETLLDLGGLPLTRLSVASGASDTRVRFDRPNPARMRSLTLSTGAASIVADRLGNANAAEIVVRSAVGEVALDMSGTWQSDSELRAEVVLGALTIRVPADLGVRVETSRLLASFSHAGLRARDGAFVSDNWDSAQHKLRVYAQTMLGFLTVERR